MVKTGWRGRRPLPPDEQRKHAVTCRLTDAEAERVDRLRGGMTRGEWLRTAALKRPPRVVPELNRQAWQETSRLASNLNQLVRLMHQGGMPAVSALAADVADVLIVLRRLLVGAVVDLDGVGEGESESEG